VPASASRVFFRLSRLTTLYPGRSRICDPIRNSAAVLARELVTEAVHGFEMHRIRRVSLQFLPQLEHMGVHGPCTRIIPVTPNLTQKFFARNEAFRVLHHEFQDLKFVARKRNWLTATH
jgi:hypothetical protein